MGAENVTYEDVVNGLRDAGCDPREIDANSCEAKCPVHQGERHNLSVRRGDRTPFVLHCNAHDCKFDDIMAAIGLGKDADNHRNGTAANGKTANGWSTPEGAAEWWKRKHNLKEPRLYPYFRANGAIALYIARYPEAPKDLKNRPISYDRQAGRWRLKWPSAKEEKYPLYRIKDIAPLETVWLHEGEKCAQCGWDIGLPSTATAGGCTRPGDSDLTPLAGKSLNLIPDNDEEGEKYREKLCALLKELDPRPVVRVVRLPVTGKGHAIDNWLTEVVPDGWDDEQCRTALERLAAEAPVVNWDTVSDVPAKAPAAKHATPDRESFCNYRLETDDDGKEHKEPLDINAIASDLTALTKAWPKRVRDALFARDEHHKPIWLNSPTRFFAWVDRYAEVDFASRGSRFITMPRLYEHPGTERVKLTPWRPI